MMAPPMIPAARPGAHQPPRQACAGVAAETASVATTASATSDFFIAVPFLSRPRQCLSGRKFHTPLEQSMNGGPTDDDQSWLHRVVLCDAKRLFWMASGWEKIDVQRSAGLHGRRGAMSALIFTREWSAGLQGGIARGSM